MRVVRRTAAAAWQRVDGEMVLMQADAGELLGLNPVGARAWELIDGARTDEEIAALIAAEFAVEPAVVARDLAPFLAELAAAGLAELTDP